MKFKVWDTKNKKYVEDELQDLALKGFKNLVYCDMEGCAIEEDGTLIILDECGNYEYLDSDRFKIEIIEES